MGTCPHNAVSQCQHLAFPLKASESTIVDEWQLVCERAYLAPMTMSAFMAGVMLGALACGALADAVGRKKTLLAALLGMICTTGAASATSSYTVYIVLRFADGFCASGYILASFVLLNELIGEGLARVINQLIDSLYAGSSWRGIMGNVTQACFAVGIVLYSLAAYYVRFWRDLTAMTAYMGLPLLAVIYWVPESPRWLQGKGRTQEAVAVLRLIASRNGQTLSASGAKSVDDDHSQNEKAATKTNNGGNLCDLFTRRALFSLTVVQIYSWFVNSATYYGLTLAAAAGDGSGQQGDRYMSTALSGAVELPAYALTILLLAR